jgi:hypothetical protein
MSKLRILYAATEIDPFLQTTKVAEMLRRLPASMQEMGCEIRIFVPRFGIINERKNRLHEVVRLSGINIAVGDDEKPLVIKVASIPTAKLQVYFIDNEDYFHRKSALVLPRQRRARHLLLQGRARNGEKAGLVAEHCALLRLDDRSDSAVPEDHLQERPGVQGRQVGVLDLQQRVCRQIRGQHPGESQDARHRRPDA